MAGPPVTSSGGVVLGLGPSLEHDAALLGLLAAGIVAVATGLHHLAASARQVG